LICIKRDCAEFTNLAALLAAEAGGFQHFTAVCYLGNKVRFRRTRYLTLFFAAMFFANNVAAAVRACVVDLAAQQHVAISALAAAADESLCPPSDDAGPCLTHYAQSRQNDEQKFLASFPAAAFVPVLAVLQVPFPAKPKPVVVASAPPIVGPSLTILFGNYRN
jgi:hypothetical protein